MEPLKRKLELRHAALSVRADYGDAQARAEANKIASALRIAHQTNRPLAEVAASLGVNVK